MENAEGWADEFEGREVGTARADVGGLAAASRTSRAYLLDDLQSGRDRMPILVLDEGARARGVAAGPAPAHAAERTLGRPRPDRDSRGTFDCAAQRVLAILANQAAAALSASGQMSDHARDVADHDGLPALYNRRAFNELLARAVAREDRQGAASPSCSSTSTTSRSSTTPTAIPRATPPCATPRSS